MMALNDHGHGYSRSKAEKALWHMLPKAQRGHGGSLLLSFDIDAIKKAGYPVTTQSL